MSTRPRMRSIKPELWQDEAVGDLSRDARLLFIGLITMADDEGRFRALPSLILGHVFPYDVDALRRLDGWLREVADAGLIVLYEVDGRPYGVLPGFRRHQRINRPSPSRLPAPPITEDSVNAHGVGDETPRTDGHEITERSSPRSRALWRGSDRI